ncbi:hypothetical protein MBLNU13_g04215t2 [Cladosporium sp. NU13]
MALPYPEGEVFFKRSTLKNNDGGLDPDNLKGGSYTRNHLNYCEGKYNKREKYYYYNHMIVMFGSKEGFEKTVQSRDGRHYSRHSDIKREIRIKLPGNTEEYEKRQKGGPLMTVMTPIELDPKEPYMYIDLIFPIRAIYFPLAQKPSSVFPDLCSYLMVDFRLRQGIAMYDDVEGFSLTYEPPSTFLPELRDPMERYERALEEGVKMVPRLPPSTPMDFDLYAGLGNKPDIYNYLILPRQMRSVERGLYQPSDPSKSLIRVHDIGCINTTSKYMNETTITQDLSFKLDLTKVLEGHLGVQVVWQPFDIPEPEDANKLIVDVFEAGLCFIPVVGPLASNCFGLFIEIVKDPEAFKALNPFEMNGYLLADAAAAAEEIADSLPKYSKVGKMAKFLGTVGGALTKFTKPT